MNIADVKRNAFAMPLTSPSFPPGPYRFVNRESCRSLNLWCPVFRFCSKNITLRQNRPATFPCKTTALVLCCGAMGIRDQLLKVLFQ